MDSNYYDTWPDSGIEASQRYYLANCHPPVFKQAIELLYPRVISCFVFGLLTRMMKDELTFHMVSVWLGMSFLYLTNMDQLFIHALLTYSTYSILSLLSKIPYFSRNMFAYTYAFFSVCIILYFEINGNYKSFDWVNHRAITITAMMKIYSLIADTHRPVSNMMPSVITFSGYMFCPATIYGPFITLKDYRKFLINKAENKWNFTRLFKICIYSVSSVVFYMIGNCVGPDLVQIGSNKFIMAFRKGLGFRFNIYAKAYAVGANLMIAGFNSHRKASKGYWSYAICRPFNAEFPRCLASTLLGLDLATFRFAAQYFNKGIMKYQGYILFITMYTIVVFINTPNMEVVIFVGTIYTFTNIVYAFREDCCNYFSICVGTYPCGKCRHVRKDKWILIGFVNLMFSILAICFSTYLCLLMDDHGFLESKSAYESSAQKWSHLQFYGHHAILIIVISKLFLV